MKSLIVHIGPYKTGSTAIQRALAARRPSLESAGILYPTSRKTLPLEAHHSLAASCGPGRVRAYPWCTVRTNSTRP